MEVGQSVNVLLYMKVSRCCFRRSGEPVPPALRRSGEVHKSIGTYAILKNECCKSTAWYVFSNNVLVTTAPFCAKVLPRIGAGNFGSSV
jgi:hypothetical protein